MRIVIDLQGAQTASRHRGIGRYSLALALAMVKRRQAHEVLIVLNGMFPETIEPIRAAFWGLLPQENIRVWFAPGPVAHINPDNAWRGRVAEVLRADFIASLKPDVIHITSMIEGYDDDAVHSIGVGPLQGVPTVVTLYDLIPLMQRDVYLKPHQRFEAFYMERLTHLSRASAFLAISNSSRQEVIQYLHAPPERVKNIYAAVDERFKPLEIASDEKFALRLKFGLTKPFLMYSGASDERKNHLRLIEAFSMLPPDLRGKYQLAIVGRLPHVHRQGFEAQIKSCGLTSHEVVITGAVDDRELIALYNMTELFVFPSWHEGFGLPALEAMSCGAPVIGSNTSSVPEVIGRADALFDPFDSTAISRKITEVLSNHALRQDLRRVGIEKAGNFSWDRSAESALTAIEDWFEQRNHSTEAIQTHTAEEQYVAQVCREIASIPDTPPDEQSLRFVAKALTQNHRATKNKHLFVDVSELTQRDTQTGIQRVVRSIASGLLNDPPAGYMVHLVYTLPGVHGYRHAKQFTASLLGHPPTNEHDDWIEVYSGDIFLGLDLNYLVLQQDLFFKHLREIGVHTHFVVYDILPIIAPELFPPHVVQVHTQWLEFIARGDDLLCISATVAEQVARALPSRDLTTKRPLEINWFHLGADINQSIPSTGLPDNADEVLTALASKSTFLMVGTLEPRKGIMQAVQAFDVLWKDGCDVNLVLVGKPGWDQETLMAMIREHKELGQRLFWLSGVSDEFLQKIYDVSDCLIAASHHEGFGLPLIEAAKLGLPIIARDIPVFREVASTYAYYFPDQHDPESMAVAIRRWIGLRAQDAHPKSEAMPWLTWQQSVEQIVAVLQRSSSQ
ncbi:glycosyltransferase family 4 protein [Zwartia vadi]|uniref:glycosyltransferase family 4 protein n=1 Tax=Zwartia vadi TaxID=3058168 RepID=UPI0025B3B2AD|nr:glycosyltransferase family 1 protein [Zwartia vadi]MDN3988224.1 glycosyltransferase family 1 protein [Zwartia vadi]